MAARSTSTATSSTSTPRLYAAAGYAVLSVNPRGSSGRGFDFSRAIYADWGNLDAQDISAGITHAIDAGIADPQRIGVFGWSYGGILTDYMIASDPRIRAAVSGAGVANVLATFGVDMYAREYMFELGAPWENFDTWRKLAYPFLHPERITRADAVPVRGATTTTCPASARSRCTRRSRSAGCRRNSSSIRARTTGSTVPSYLVHRLRSNIEWFDRWLKKRGH